MLSIEILRAKVGDKPIPKRLNRTANAEAQKLLGISLEGSVG
jgi:hypothetical protein